MPRLLRSSPNVLLFPFRLWGGDKKGFTLCCYSKYPKVEREKKNENIVQYVQKKREESKLKMVKNLKEKRKK